MATTAPHVWTENDNYTLWLGQRANVSNAEIAKALGVSERDVEERIYELQFIEAI